MDTIQIGDLSVRLNRSPHTIRRWEREGIMPEHLLPERDKKDRRIWNLDQVEHIREWMQAMDLRSGKAFTSQNEGWSVNGRGKQP